MFWAFAIRTAHRSSRPVPRRQHTLSSIKRTRKREGPEDTGMYFIVLTKNHLLGRGFCNLHIGLLYQRPPWSRNSPCSSLLRLLRNDSYEGIARVGDENEGNRIYGLTNETLAIRRYGFIQC